MLKINDKRESALKYILFFFIPAAFGADNSTIDKLLSEILSKSYSVQSIDHLEKSEIINLDSSLNQFKPTFFISSGYSETDVVATSPFAAEKSKQFNYDLGASKLWKSGIQTGLTYNAIENETYFSTRDDFLYTSPKLELSISTSLFQNILSKRYNHLVNNQKAQIHLTKFSRNIDRKSILLQSLIDYTKILELDQSL